MTGCQDSPGADTDQTVPANRELVDLRGRILGYTQGFRPDGDYDAPDGEQREQLARAVGRLVEGDARGAERLLAPLGLGVTRLTDTDSRRRYDEIAATRPGPGTHWGRLYLTADSRVRWNVQVPHPVADRATESLGVRLLEGTPGGSLVLAGAHRRAGDEGAADVAHREDSAFHAIVLELQKRGVPGLQLHGKSGSSAKKYDAVLSTGAARSAPAEVHALADRLKADGIRVCRGWAARCPLEGARNVQGRAAQRRHVTFVHLELAPGFRTGGRDTEELAAAAGGLLSAWAKG
ncbi:hypothetical protein [Streptomyces sp. SID8352]|uniref:hypothetical protein n=1 Tax=Streptomyces sp. SID8352 TaxID=2690338 RepID=UPI0031F679DF